MKCKCGGDTKVVDTRPTDGKQWRRRACMECGTRFNTIELVEEEVTCYAYKLTHQELEPPKVVVKKAPYVAETTANKIREKKRKARHMIEDMRMWEKTAEDDLFWNGDYQDEHSTY